MSFRRLRAPLIIAAFLLALCIGSAQVRSAPAVPSWRIVISGHPTPLFYVASGIALGGSGNIFIADSGDHRILKLSPSGVTLNSWGTDAAGVAPALRGEGPYFTGPFGVAVTAAGYIYVADGALVKLSPSGAFLHRWSTGALAQAFAVVASPDGSIYTLSLRPVGYPLGDTSGHDRMTITRLAGTGRILGSWVFSYPDTALDTILSAAMAAAPNGNIVLSIRGQHHCHDCDGTYYQLWMLSPAGKVLNKWSVPAGGEGVAVDSSGTIYVAGNGKIFTFGSDGKPLTSWGSPGCGLALFGGGLRLAVNAQGILYAADSAVAGLPPGALSGSAHTGVLHVMASDGAPIDLYGQCPTTTSTLFGQIQSLAFAPDGTMYVDDEVAGAIIGYPPGVAAGGNTRRAPGARIPTNHSPFVATDSRGYVYAEDLQTSTLEQYGPGGVLTAKVVGPALEGMAVDRSGYIYGLTFGGTVQVLKPVRGSRPTAGIVRQWVLPGYGRGTGGLVPSGIAVDGKGNVYVADIRFGAIKKFTTAGKLLATWGAKPGSAPGRFRYPGGLATDARGHVFVLDSGNNRVQELDGSGHVLGVWGRWGEGLAQFMRPHGIATDPRGNVYVGDTFNDRIQELTFGA